MHSVAGLVAGAVVQAGSGSVQAVQDNCGGDQAVEWSIEAAVPAEYCELEGLSAAMPVTKVQHLVPAEPVLILNQLGFVVFLAAGLGLG